MPPLTDVDDVLGVVTLIITIILAINIVLAVITLFYERRNPASLWAWILVMFFIPVLGWLLYFFVGRRLTNRKIFQMLQGSSTDYGQLALEQKTAINDGTFPFHNEATRKHADVAELLMTDRGARLADNNAVTVYDDGNAKFDALIEDIRRARDHVHVHYYIFRSDDLGLRILDALAERAEAGVEVKLCYDALGGKSVKKRHLARLRAAGGQIYPFFPSKFIFNFRVNYRTHRKMVVIDGSIGWVGGFNVGNEYLGLDDKFGYWRDTHLRIVGDAVPSLQRRVMMDWNAAAAPKDRIDWEDRYFHMPDHRVGDVALQIVSSGPDSAWERIKFGYVKMITTAQHSVWIQSPYFMPDASVLEALKIAALSGVDVRLMIPDKPDHLLVYPATLSYADELVAVGAKVHIYDGGFLHAKTVLVDHEIGSVGTANMDYRSFHLNFEVNAFFYDADLGEELRDIFLRDQEQCHPFVHEQIYRRKIISRIKESVSRLVSPLL